MTSGVYRRHSRVTVAVLDGSVPKTAFFKVTISRFFNSAIVLSVKFAVDISYQFANPRTLQQAHLGLALKDVGLIG